MVITGKAAAGALVRARAAMKSTVTKESRGNFGKYADLANVIAAITPALSDNGLALVQEIEVVQSDVVASAMLVHESGESIEFCPLMLPIGERRTAQAIGAVITYARRYQLMALFGLAPDDDVDNTPTTPQDGVGRAQGRNMTVDTPTPYKTQQRASTPATAQPSAVTVDDAPEVDADGPDNPFGEPEPEPVRASDGTLRRLHAIGTSVYGDEWDGKRHELVERITKGRTHSSAHLTPDEAKRMIRGMEAKQAEQQQPDAQLRQGATAQLRAPGTGGRP